MHNYVAAQGSPRGEEMRPSLQGKGIGKRAGKARDTGTAWERGWGAEKRPQAQSSRPSRDTLPPQSRRSSSSKAKQTPERPALSHLVGETSAKGPRLGQVGVTGCAGWVSLPTCTSRYCAPQEAPPYAGACGQSSTHTPSVHPSLHPSVCLSTSPSVHPLLPEDPLCVRQPTPARLTRLGSCLLRPFPPHPCCP